MIMYAAPVGAFGAMAFTIGSYGLHSLLSLAKLMGTFYLTCLAFIFGVLGLVARLHGFSIFRYLRYIGEELLLVLGTSSSEVALPLIAHGGECLVLQKPRCAERVEELIHHLAHIQSIGEAENHLAQIEFGADSVEELQTLYQRGRHHQHRIRIVVRIADNQTRLFGGVGGNEIQINAEARQRVRHVPW